VRRWKNRVVLRVEAAEPRRLPSGFTAGITLQTYEAVAAGVARVAATLARTQDVALASASLSALSAKVPPVAAQLETSWMNDLAGFRPGVPGSALATKQRLLNDLKSAVLGGNSSGGSQGPGPSPNPGHPVPPAPPKPQPQPSLDSVTIVNQTGSPLSVAAYLGNSPVGLIKTIAKGGSALFDFGSSTGSFIAASVSRPGLSQPPPLFRLPLDHPITGYNGTSFTISVFAGYFSVTG
jgi:hypothetical protein